MSIITFWNETREQSGRTMTAVATATRLAMERNNRILLISTSFGDTTFNRCFWEDPSVKNAKLFGNAKANNIAVETGIEGLFKIIASKKLTPEIITDYTKVIFKGRLEVIEGFSKESSRVLVASEEQIQKMQDSFLELIKTANQYYDIVIVDLDKNMRPKAKQDILNISDVNVYVLSQKIESIEKYKELKKQNQFLMKTKCIPVIGRYMPQYKYNTKNIARNYLGEKRELDVLPFNLLYMAAADEFAVVDLFLRLNNIKDKTDENYIFMQATLNLTHKIMKKLQDVQMKMR